MKKLIITTLLLALTSFASAQVTVSMSGRLTANTPGVTAGKTGLLLVQTGATAFSDFTTSLTSELLFNRGSDLISGFNIVGINTVAAGGGPFPTAFNADSTQTFNLNENGVVGGANFGIIIFDSSSTGTVAGDSYSIFTGSDWTLPSAAGTYTSGSAWTALGTGDTALVSGTVVPEPSTYALLAGFAAFLFVAIRRRNA